ncbi:MAG: hypothetical protein AB7I59_14050 [Geminicoccaceae bacterium]
MTATLAILGLIAFLVVYEVLDHRWDRSLRAAPVVGNGDSADPLRRG